MKTTDEIFSCILVKQSSQVFVNVSEILSLLLIDNLYLDILSGEGKTHQCQVLLHVERRHTFGHGLACITIRYKYKCSWCSVTIFLKNDSSKPSKPGKKIIASLGHVCWHVILTSDHYVGTIETIRRDFKIRCKCRDLWIRCNCTD